MKITFLTALLTILVFSAKAQKTDSITTEEMRRYAIMMDSVEAMKKTMAEANAKLAQGNQKISAARYAKLLPLLDDQKKLTEAKATADEISYLKKAMEIRNKNANSFQSAFSSLLIDVGQDTYTKVSKAVASDPRVKERYILEINKLNETDSKAN